MNCESAGVRAVLGNAANEEIMQLAHLECAKWLILTIPNGYEAGEIVASARAKNPDIEIIARAHYDDEVAYITERGANQVVMGEREIARTMLELLETPPAGEGGDGGKTLIPLPDAMLTHLIRPTDAIVVRSGR